MAAGVVYTTFHHPLTQANVITTDFSDWATNCPEFKVTACRVTPSNGPTDYQKKYMDFADQSRRIEPAEAADVSDMAEPLQRVIATKVHSGSPSEKTRVLPKRPVALSTTARPTPC